MIFIVFRSLENNKFAYSPSIYIQRRFPQHKGRDRSPGLSFAVWLLYKYVKSTILRQIQIQQALPEIYDWFFDPIRSSGFRR